MRTFKAFIFILIFCAWFMTSCQSKKQRNAEKSKEIEKAAFSIEELQSKAAHDSNFRNSKMYSAYMEKACIENSKKNAQLNDKGKLLLEFEVALTNLKESTDKLKHNSALSKNEQFITLVRLKADKVREYQQRLKKLPLEPKEQEQYDRLCRL